MHSPEGRVCEHPPSARILAATGGVRAGGSSVAFMLLSSQGVAWLNCSAALAEAAGDGANRRAALADSMRWGIVTPTSLGRLAHVLQTNGSLFAGLTRRAADWGPPAGAGRPREVARSRTAARVVAWRRVRPVGDVQGRRAPHIGRSAAPGSFLPPLSDHTEGRRRPERPVYTPEWPRRVGAHGYDSVQQASLRP